MILGNPSDQMGRDSENHMVELILSAVEGSFGFYSQPLGAILE